MGNQTDCTGVKLQDVKDELFLLSNVSLPSPLMYTTYCVDNSFTNERRTTSVELDEEKKIADPFTCSKPPLVAMSNEHAT